MENANNPTTCQVKQLTTSQCDDPLERIGHGSCGSVWADSFLYPDIDGYNPDTASSSPVPVVLKRGDGLPDRSLENEDTMHRHILSTIRCSRTWLDKIFGGSLRINIPRHVTFLQPDSPLWEEVLPRVPQESAAACQALISERILPLPMQTRRALVEKFWSPPRCSADVDSVVHDKSNEHCLARPYLGRRRPNLEGRVGPRFFNSISLRNYPLHIDQLEDLGLDGREYAVAMADGLAFLLWVCELDAGDVEFVLARPRPVEYPGEDCHIGTKTFACSGKERILGEHEMWILDFDCCGRIPMTVEGVNTAAERFWRNDPFYPNPGKGPAGTVQRDERDETLWKAFKERFLDTSEKIMDVKCKVKEEEGDVGGGKKLQMSLPGRFVKRVEETVGVYSRGVPGVTGA